MSDTSYTSQEDATLLRMRGAGSTMQQVADALKRSYTSVCQRASLLRRPPRQKGSPWTFAMEQELRRLMALGTSYGAAARKLGVTKNAVIGFAKRNKIAVAAEHSEKMAHINSVVRQAEGARTPKVTPELIARVREAAGLGYSLPRTALLIGISENSVRNVSKQHDISFNGHTTSRIGIKPIILDYQPIVVGPARTCQYVTGKEGRKTFFCGEVSEPGHSWCNEHCARVFVRRPPAEAVACAA